MVLTRQGEEIFHNAREKIKDMEREKGSIKWNYLFDSEIELVEALKQIPVINEYNRYYKGSAYINSFGEQLRAGKELSPKQKTMMKRISKEIFIAFAIKDFWKE